MNKIASDHLAREAVVYIRQSTPDQLRHNHESRRRQYGLADRARGLGWDEPVVIDEDLGRSGGGTSRPGFDRLLVAICEGRVGIVLSLEASRLARNGRDWHTLLEFCALVGCLLGDEDGLYDPRLPNDRLLLWYEGDAVRDGALDAAPALARGAAAQGVARRALPRRGGRLREGPPRSDRQGSRRARAPGHRSRVPQVRGVPEHPPGPPLAAAGGSAAAGCQDRWREAPHCLEAAGLRHRPQADDQPRLRRRVRVWPDGEPRDRRERT